VNIPLPGLEVIDISRFSIVMGTQMPTHYICVCVWIYISSCEVYFYLTSSNSSITRQRSVEVLKKVRPSILEIIQDHCCIIHSLIQSSKNWLFSCLIRDPFSTYSHLSRLFGRTVHRRDNNIKMNRLKCSVRIFSASAQDPVRMAGDGYFTTVIIIFELQ
jgi:hypothetical protein